MFQRTDSGDVQACKCPISNTQIFYNVGNIGPAPKLSRTPGRSTDTTGILNAGQHTIELLQELQYPEQVY